MKNLDQQLVAVLNEMERLKGAGRIPTGATTEDLFIENGRVYFVETYPVSVDTVDVHGQAFEIEYKPALQTAVYIMTL